MDTILLTGKTGLFSKDVLEYIGYETQVFLTGQKTGGRLQGLPDTIRMFPVTPSDNDFRKVFELGEIRAVWHVSGCADGGRVTDESANIERIAKLCSYYSIPRLIVITESADKSDFPGLIRKWSSPSDGSSQVRVAVVQTPFLTGSGLAGGRLDRIFTAMRRDETVCLEGGRDREISVLAMQELSALLMRMSTENWFQPGIYEAGGSRGTQEELRETLLSIRPGARIEYPGSSGSLRHGTLHMLLPATDSNVCDGKLEEIYRLPVSTDWTREIAEQYSALAEESGEASPLRERLTGFMQKSGKIAGTVLDLAIMFLLAEYLARITSESVYFKIVDVRLIFVILMGMMHGIAAGFAAAILECVMLVMRYNEIGISGLLLFYNVENWIPFVYYLTAGAISGYSHQKREQQTRSVMKENELIRNKYLFLNEAYRTSVSNRKDLWTQILSEEDSYGKIYGAVRQMKQRTPEAVCVEAVRVLRRLLDNGTVLIYQLDPGSKKALLLSCCRDTGGRQAIDMAECAEMFRTVQSGETWKNIHFSEYAPMYAARVKYNRMLGRNYTGTQEITYLVAVEKAGRDQLSLWYMNHFTILCGLFQDALESAALRERTLS